MCIISGPVTSVNATKIFAMPSKNSTRQLTVYANSVSSPADNLMCLPVPFPETVEFESVPADLFTQCERSFTRVATLSATRSAGPMLEVRSHGSYDVVLIPSVDDTARVPRQFATLTPEVVAFMRREYGGRPFGFLLCRLKAGAADYEPFAYSHATDGASLFLPTMHFHSHGWGAAMDADWDHKIYTVRTPTTAHKSMFCIPRPRNEIDWSRVSTDFAVGSERQLRCMEIAGNAEPNRDIVIPIAG